MQKLLNLLILFLLIGCTTTLPPVPNLSEPSESLPFDRALVVGHVMTVLIGPTTRWDAPELRFFELTHTTTQDRIRIHIESKDRWFILPLPPGDYELSRMQFSEGGFLAMASLSPGFTATLGQVSYVGTWRLGIASPQYDRSVFLSAITEDEETIRQTLAPYRSLHDRSISTNLLTPATVETRLYEIPPYPRIWWFRRHHTS